MMDHLSSLKILRQSKTKLSKQLLSPTTCT